MNIKSLSLLEKLIDGDLFKIYELAEELNISGRQVRYIINDVNAYLKFLNLPTVSLIRNEGIRLSLNKDEKATLYRNFKKIGLKDYLLSSEERQIYILLLMFCTNKPLTSQYLADQLAVSKSSIDKDLQSIRRDEKGFGLNLAVRPGKGSYLSGDEKNIRLAFQRMIERNFDLSKYFIKEEVAVGFIQNAIYTKILEPYIDGVIEIIQDTERYEHRRITYCSFKNLCIYTVVLINRIKLGYYVYLNELIYHDVLGTEAYVLADKLCTKLEDRFGIAIKKSERLYCGVLLKGLSFVTLDNYAIKDWAKVQILASALAKDVGEKLNYNFVDDEELINSLTLHLGITTLNLTGQFPLVNPELDLIKKTYYEVFNVVAEVITKLNNPAISALNEDDIAYLALHFCASIERLKRLNSRYYVLIVCVQGIGTASLIKEMITTRFKNIIVRKITTRMSIKEQDLDCIDFVITSVNLEGLNKPIIKVNPILSERDYRQIESAMKHVKHENYTSDDFIAQIMAIVKKYADISDDLNLKNELTGLLSDCGIKKAQSQLRLNSFLTESTVEVVDSVKDLEDAVKQSCSVLIKQNKISEDYESSIIKTINESDAYMVIDEGIALIHGEISKAVNEVSMSLLMIKRGVKFGHREFDPVHMILCLAATDTCSHISALNDFIKFARNYKKNKEYYFNKKLLMKMIEEASSYD